LIPCDERPNDDRFSIPGFGKTDHGPGKRRAIRKESEAVGVRFIEIGVLFGLFLQFLGPFQIEGFEKFVMIASVGGVQELGDEFLPGMATLEFMIPEFGQATFDKEVVKPIF
jgi:hypothetical protein